jgi:hypothetical protein
MQHMKRMTRRCASPSQRQKLNDSERLAAGTSLLWSAAHGVGGAREANLFDRRHRRANHPGEGCDLFFEGQSLGCEVPMLQGVSVALGSPAAGTVHPADAMTPHRRRPAL